MLWYWVMQIWRVRGQLRRWIERRRSLLAKALLATALVLVLLMVWRGPWWFDGRYLSTRSLREGSAALVTGFRTSVVQITAAGGALVALSFTARTYRLNQRGQVTDRFTKALERLGSDKEYVRVGGILALHQVVRDAPDHATDAIHGLNVFVRERSLQASSSRAESLRKARRAATHRGSHTMTLNPRNRALPIDVQAALTALTHGSSRRHVDPSQRIDLSGLNLSGAMLDGADLSGEVWVKSGFEPWAEGLRRPKIFPGRLMQVKRWAPPAIFDTNGPKIHRTDLEGADLFRAELSYACFTNANLCGTNLAGARLVGADLTGASMKGANLTGAILDGALLDTDLSDVEGLVVEQLESATLRHPMWLPDDVAGDPRIEAYFRKRPHLLRLGS
ncbi:pentapeptide repeat-containing protein [Streptomyces sp. NPDC020096]